MNNEHMYMKVLRVGAGAASIALWWVSVQFSVEGFSITLPELVWVGWVLAGSVTLLQLIFNKGVYNNPTLFLAGILAYVYGVITNIIGIMRAQQIFDNLMDSISEDPGHVAPRFIMAIVLALVIEIVPEALLLWAIFLDRAKVGDFVSSVLQGTSLSKKKGKNVPRNVHKSVQKPVHAHSGTKPDENRTNYGRGTRTGNGQDERDVARYCGQHKEKHGSLPTVRTVADATGISKTRVGDIMKTFRPRWES